MKIYATIFLILIVSIVILNPGYTQEKQIKGAISEALDEKIPWDPNVRMGTLENGMKYYIRKNSKPEDKIEFRLVLNAGAMQENEDQRGLAHFIEHMAFNGSKNFKKNELVNYLQSIGVEFGADLNAYTSFDETVYMLPIPTGNEETINKGLQVLEDWASGVEFTEEEIDKERGVVIEEWRLGRGASQRMRDQYLPVLFKDSRYAERLPIGKKSVIENASYETIRQFYRDWYRPNLMAIVAVGDLEPTEIEQKIKERFGKLKGPENERERKEYNLPDHDETFIVVLQDKEASFTNIQIAYKQNDKKTENTLREQREKIINSLYSVMINQRLNELTQAAEPPFLYGYSSYGSIYGVKPAYQSNAVVGETGVEKGLRTLLEENARVKKYGFTDSEFQRAKKELRNVYERNEKEAEKYESRQYAREYVNAFLEKEVATSADFDLKFFESTIGSINLSEINSRTEKWIRDKNRVVIITGPEKEGLTPISSEKVRALLDNIDDSNIKPYEDKLSNLQLFDKDVEIGKVVNTIEHKDVGVTEMKLSNGATVVLKPTEFKNDEILMSAMSEGGYSLYEERFSSAAFAGQVIGQGGVDNFNRTDLTKLFAGKSVRVSPYISNYAEGINGFSAPKDIETMFQLIHLYFTSPRKDEDAFSSYKAQNMMIFKNISSNPTNYFSIETLKLMSQNHPKAIFFPSEEDMNKIDLDIAYDIYKERFSDVGSFTFYFVGNFKIKEVLPLIEKYIGSLPSLDNKEIYKDMGIRPPKGDFDKVIYKGTDPKSRVSIQYRGEVEYSPEENFKLIATGELLSNRLIDIIREEKSGVYGVGASGSISRIPYESYRFTIAFPCGPENVKELTQAVYDEIDRIKKEGVSEADLAEIKEAQRLDRKENLQKNRYWLNNLSAFYRYEIDLDKFYDYEKRIESLTTNDIRETVKKYLKDDNRYQFVLLPESEE
ncbi:MAG: insulinase family protein [Cyclobacteriaceae bacterium]